MFSSLSLFRETACPDKAACTRPACLFSHRADLPPPPPLVAPTARPTTSAVPSKRPAAVRPPSGEPPRKIKIVGSASARKPVPVQSPSAPATGPPTLHVSAAASRVAVPVRQAMLKTLYDHFTVLYNAIIPANPTIASDHALRQEDEVYQQASKSSYRNAMIQSAASLKKRALPDSIQHDSVGTAGDIAARVEARNSLKAFRLTADHLKPHILSLEAMTKWGYVIDIPQGEGGTQPSLEGCKTTCERCKEQFFVKENPDPHECLHHWGRPYTKKTSVERIKVYSCCSKPTSDVEACSRGPHVFYESDPTTLHARHAFSFLPPPSPSHKASLDIVALDCEMIYTTGGMRVARVSIIDAAGTEVFDEIVQMDPGVHILDFNTRFSGITQEIYSTSKRPLADIRNALNSLINSETILIGHALENDLKTLRIVHHRCIDTAIMFPHPHGPPYRRALRDLARNYLNIRIQGNSTAGHSSIEDSVATLDLVRWFFVNGQPKAMIT